MSIGIIFGFLVLLVLSIIAIRIAEKKFWEEWDSWKKD